MSHIDLERLRRGLTEGRIAIWLTSHADVEMRKDGLKAIDVERTVLEGERIENYPDRERCLLLGFTRVERIPVHVCIEYQEGDPEVVIVTAYVPQRPDWIGHRRRRKR